ncbi:MAG: hypothetical protein PHR61_02550 [Candidatus Absconditabacteria bacterium]|nr:hypothetical protein [Candidatus Absconditabacteria bacterium]
MMKNNIKSILHKTGFGASLLAGFLLTSKDALAQNIASNQKNKAQIENNQAANNINIRNTNNPIGYAFDNINKYYPIKNNPKVNEHITKLRKELNSTRGKIQIEQANKIFKSIQRGNTYGEKDIITFIVSTTECDIISKGTIFTDTYRPEDYTEEEDIYYNTFKKKYIDRFTAYEKQFNENLVKLQQRIKEMEQSIQNREQSIQNREQSIQNREQNIKRNIESINESLSVFTPEQVIENQYLYDNIKKIKQGFQENGRKGSLHTEKLFSVIK